MQKRTKISLLILFSIIVIIITYFFDDLLLKAIPYLRIQCCLNLIIAFLGSSPGAITLVIFLSLLLFYEKKTKLIPYLITAFILAFILGCLLKYIILRPRPDIIPLLIKTSPAFPSLHAMVASSTFFFIRNLKTKHLAITITAITAFSGFYNGVHYLSDILAGIFLGIIISYLTFKKAPAIFKRIKQKLKSSVTKT